LIFWSTSRSSVNSTRRSVFQRASSAAIEAATPTFSSSVNRKSLGENGASIPYLLADSLYFERFTGADFNASQSLPICKAAHGEAARSSARPKVAAALFGF
jgi:hypothetical protein